MNFPLKMDKVLIFKDKLTCKGVSYGFDQIISIETFPSFKILKDGRRSISKMSNIVFNIKLKFFDNIEEVCSEEIFLKKEDLFLNFLSGYDYLCRQSFNERHQNFLNQVKTKGYFSYGGAQFYPDGKVISEKNKNKLNIKTCEVKQNKMQTRLMLVPVEENLLVNKKKSLKISIIQNKDVFFAILRVVYQLKIERLY